VQVMVTDRLPASVLFEANPLALTLARPPYLVRPAVRSWSLGQGSAEQSSLVDEARSIWPLQAVAETH